MVIGKHFTKYYFKYAITFILGIAALIVVDIYQLKLPDIVGGIIDAIAAGEAIARGETSTAEVLTTEMLVGYIVDLVIMLCVVFVGRFVWRICIFGNGVKIETDIRNEMFEHMEKMSVTYYTKNKTGALMALYTNDLSTIRRAFAGGTLMLIDALTLGIVAFVKMVRMSWQFTLISFVPLVLVSAFAAAMRRRISRKVKRNLEAFAALSDYVQEDFSGISVIKAYVKEKRKEFLFGKYNKENMDTCMDFVKDQALVQVLVNVVISIGMYGVIFLGGILLYQTQIGNLVGSFTIGNLITFNSLLGALVWPLMAIGDLINLRGQSKASEKRVSELLDEPVDINDDNVNYQEMKVTDIKGSIKFNDVTFRYPASPVDSLSNVSFDIEAGEMVGIMGATGSGKTTIVELLLRLYNLPDDKILVDGFDIMHLPVKFVRDVIAYVPQETFLFKDTIDENIAFSMDDIDKDLTHFAAEHAGIAKDVSEFKDGYDTVLGERGVTVSGGQKQRIAIARALVKDAPILIMDDSLSAVDTITESFILDSLRKLRAGKTTIIIAHRITTLETLDKIIVVDDGKISDVGKHEELLTRNAIYQNEVHLQELEKEMEVE